MQNFQCGRFNSRPFPVFFNHYKYLKCLILEFLDPSSQLLPNAITLINVACFPGFYFFLEMPEISLSGWLYFRNERKLKSTNFCVALNFIPEFLKFLTYFFLSSEIKYVAYQVTYQKKKLYVNVSKTLGFRISIMHNRKNS